MSTISFNPALPTLCKPVDNFLTTLTANHTSGSGTLTVASTTGLGTPTSSSPVRVTVIKASNGAKCHFKVTNVTGSVLTVTAIDGYTDINFVSGDSVGAFISAGTLTDVHTAILNSQPTISWISLRNDIQIPDDATITGIGSSSFNDAGYGTLTLTSGPYSGQTVTQAIQHVLDLAATKPIGIVWDVRCSVGVQGVPGSGGLQMLSALYLKNPGNLHIVGRPGCGVILRAQCNSAIFSNENPTWGTPVSGSGTDTEVDSIGGITFSNLVIENLYVNANSGVTTGSPSSYTPGPNQPNPTYGVIYTMNAFRLFGVSNVVFRNCTIVGAGGFHVHFGNWQNILVEGCTIDSQGAGGAVGGNDCLHLNGPGDQFTIRDCLFGTEDDYVAINTADGNDQGEASPRPDLPAWGAITRVRGYNLRSLRSATNGNFIRVMANGPTFNGGHEFDGLYGTVNNFILLVNSQAGGATQGTIGSVDFRNIDVDFTNQGILCGDSPNVTIQRVGIKGVRRSGSNLTIPLMVVNHAVDQLDIEDLYVRDDGSSGTNKQQIEVSSTGTINKFSARKVRLFGFSGQKVMPLLKVDASGTVNVLSASDITSSNVLNLFLSAGSVGTSLFNGISMTGFGAGAVVNNTGAWTNSVLSNSDPSITDFTGATPSRSGDFYGNLAVPTISISPTFLAVNQSGQTLSVTGTGFTGGTTFSISGVAGTSITNTVINSGTSATLTITTGSTTGSATITCSNFATAILTVGAPLTTYLDDNFAGTTNATVVGRIPDTTQNGSDVWGAYGGTEPMVIASGGGATTGTLTGGNTLWSALYPDTSVPLNQIVTVSFVVTDPTMGIGFDTRSDGSTNLARVTVDFGNQIIRVGEDVSGSFNGTLAGYSVSLSSGVTYTLVCTFIGNAVTVVLNGTTLGTFSSLTPSSPSSTKFAILQFNQAAGAVKFTHVKVTST